MTEDCEDGSRPFIVSAEVIPDRGLRRELKIVIKSEDKASEDSPGSIIIEFSNHSFYDPFDLSRMKLPREIRFGLSYRKEVDLETVYSPDISSVANANGLKIYLDIASPSEFKELASLLRFFASSCQASTKRLKSIPMFHLSPLK